MLRLYDYQKKVKDQVSEISKLQKQISSYGSGYDISEENKSRLQKLQVELTSAKEDLQETEYEKFIDDADKLLTDLVDNYTEIINMRLDDVSALMSDMINVANANASDIRATIESELAKVGTSMSENMKSIWADGGGANTILSTFNKNFSTNMTTLITTINGISTKIQAMGVKMGAIAKEEVKQVKSSDAGKAKSTSSAKSSTASSKATTSNSKTSSGTGSRGFNEDIKRGVAAAIWIYNGSGSGWGNGSERVQKLTSKFGSANAQAVQSYINAHANNGDLYRYWISTGRSNLAQYRYNAFKKGAKKINESQMAWTQENGEEFIIRPSDGAILTPIAKSDSVLNAEATKNLWNVANDPTEFIKNNLNLGVIQSGNSNGNGATYNNDISLQVTLPNVKNYEEFKTAMQHDKNFENMIKAMTVDRMFGGSSLKKYKY